MYDFLLVKKKFVAKSQRYEYYPSFQAIPKIKDLMIRSRDFYAIVNPDTGFWVKDEAEAIEMIDKQVYEYVLNDVGEALMNDPEHSPIVDYIRDTDNHMVDKWHKFCQKDLRDRYEPLNQKIIFSNSKVKRSDYVTYSLSYPLQEEPTPYYDKLVDRLYLPEERTKFEWLVGCIIAGDQSKVQKIFVFYGEPGSGKSTIIGKVIVNTIFGGKESPYCSKFTAELLANKDSFGTGFLSRDPVLAFDDDADLSRIESNTTLNLIVSHEAVRVNDKFARTFTAYPNCFLVCGTNEAVQLSPNSGLNRRLIDIRPTGETLLPDEYDDCLEHIIFEKSGIAYKCLQTYKRLGKNHYNHYQPEEMLSRTSPFHNYVKDNFFELKDGITLANAYNIYCSYGEETKLKSIMSRYRFRDNLKLYFESYEDTFFSGFKLDRIGIKVVEKKEEGDKDFWLKFVQNINHRSLFDDVMKEQPAQYAKSDESPRKKWENVTTKLGDLNPEKLHYILIPKNHIVIDFDIRDKDGNKSLEKNLEAASKFPPTYAELSKSGEGIHLHYIYTGGDPEELSRVYSENIEVKVFTGNASLRRKLSKCNDIPIAEISSGLPLKGGPTKMVDWDGWKNAKILRTMIIKNLNKEYHAYTKPSIDYICDLLDKAYQSGVEYNVSDLEQDVLNFAMQSTNHAKYCVDRVSNSHFCSDNFVEKNEVTDDYSEAPIVIFDIESYPEDENNDAFLGVCWKYAENPDSEVSRLIKEYLSNPHHTYDDWLNIRSKMKSVVRMYNPLPSEVKDLFKFRLVGFNNRNYDNHILYARSQGYTIAECNRLSQNIIAGHKTAKFREAYNVSFTDIYDFASAGNKTGLKKWEIKLGIHHQEMSIPWDKSVPKDRIDDVMDYCTNDVLATEMVWNYLAPDFTAREIISNLSGRTENDTTNQCTTSLLVGDIDNPQQYYIYTNLSEIFPGYEFSEYGIDKDRYLPGTKIVSGKSIYKGIDPGEGGRKIGYPGMYTNVGLFDVASMHPSSMIRLNIFGDKITKRLENLVRARISIKHGDYSTAADLLGDKVKPYLTGSEEELKKSAKALADALKTAINSVYGLTSAKFDNKLKDPRNKDNIVAKYGALFMIDLEEEVTKRGYKVVHVSTDSIKIANVDDDIAAFVMDYGKRYGFTFEYEKLYSKMCLINDAVYIAKVAKEDGKDVEPYWSATGKQFAVPYVFKTLFSHEEIIFSDMCETFNVKEGAIYLDYNEGLPDDEHNYTFVGNVGQFTPIIFGEGGGVLVRIKEEKSYALQGTKGYRWLESEQVRILQKEDKVDKSYYRKLVDDAVKVISEFGDFEWFVSDNDEAKTLEDFMNLPETDEEEVPF